MLGQRRTARAAATAAALVALLVAGCTGDDNDGVSGSGELSFGGEDIKPSAQPTGSCPRTTGAPAAVLGARLNGFAFVQPDGAGLIGGDGRERTGRSVVTRRGAQVRVVPNLTDVGSIGRSLAVLYDSGRVFAIDAATCRETARRDLTATDLGLPAGSDVIWQEIGRSAGPARRLIAYGRYSPPGTELYSGFTAELLDGLKVGRTEQYGDLLVRDVWDDGSGDPLVLLNDGSVRALGTARPVVAPGYAGAKDSASVARSTAGVWISGGGAGASYLRRPDGKRTTLPEGSFAYQVIASGDSAAVLLRSRGEVWIVGRDGTHTAVPVGRFPASAQSLGDALLVVARDADEAVLIEWRRRAVTARYAVGPQPVRIVPLG